MNDEQRPCGYLDRPQGWDKALVQLLAQSAQIDHGDSHQYAALLEVIYV